MTALSPISLALAERTLCLRYGDCSVFVQPSDGTTADVLEEVAQAVPTWVQARNRVGHRSILLLSSTAQDAGEPAWREISRIWARLERSMRAPHPPGRELSAWRSLLWYGRAVDRHPLLFEEVDHQDRFFCLLSSRTQQGPGGPARQVIVAIRAVAIRWCASHGGAPLHACALARHGRGYLFLGPSGAGKSTLACSSEHVGATVVHEDQVLVSQRGQHYYLLHPDSSAAPLLRA